MLGRLKNEEEGGAGDIAIHHYNLLVKFRV